MEDKLYILKERVNFCAGNVKIWAKPQLLWKPDSESSIYNNTDKSGKPSSESTSILGYNISQ